MKYTCLARWSLVIAIALLTSACTGGTASTGATVTPAAMAAATATTQAAGHRVACRFAVNAHRVASRGHEPTVNRACQYGLTGAANDRTVEAAHLVAKPTPN